MLEPIEWFQKKGINAAHLSHPYECHLQSPFARKILKLLTRANGDTTLLERILYSYRNPSGKLICRIKYAPIHRLVDFFIRKAGYSPQGIADMMIYKKWTVRGLINVARSISNFGLSQPPHFTAPISVIWNLTNQCNLTCKHCHPDSGVRGKDELSRAQKLALIDQLSNNYVPILVLTGGEPLLDPDLWAVLERSQNKHLYCLVTTNGTLLSAETCRRLVDLGIEYVEISLDSPDPEIHDQIRGVKGAWKQSLQGIQNAGKAGLECGIATCFMKDTVDRAEDMLKLAISLKARTFVHFNFLPKGRAAFIADQRLEPKQQEELMAFFQKTLREGKIEVWSTAPQFGEVFIDFVNRGIQGTVDIPLRAALFLRYMGGCGAGRSFCAIQPNGYVNPCVSMPHNVLGDLRVSRFSEIWNSGMQNFPAEFDGGKERCCSHKCHEYYESCQEDPQISLEWGCLHSMLLFSKMESFFDSSRKDKAAFRKLHRPTGI